MDLLNHDRGKKIPQVYPILKQINPAHATTSHFSEVRYA
jgi:hypothetical protein